jgi:hypothetical protein
MARSKLNKSAYGALSTEIQNHQRNLRGNIADALEQAVEAGAESMRKTILTSGTGYVGPGPRAIAGGRIDYGAMIDDVETRPVQRHPRGSKSSFGWVYNEEDYYAFQDGGTRYIEGMHALAGATVVATDKLEQVLRTYKKRSPR